MIVTLRLTRTGLCTRYGGIVGDVGGGLIAGRLSDGLECIGKRPSWHWIGILSLTRYSAWDRNRALHRRRRGRYVETLCLCFRSPKARLQPFVLHLQFEECVEPKIRLDMQDDANVSQTYIAVFRLGYGLAMAKKHLNGSSLPVLSDAPRLILSITQAALALNASTLAGLSRLVTK